MCHAIVDTWLGDVGRRIPFIGICGASVATPRARHADGEVDECVFGVSCCRATHHRRQPDGRTGAYGALSCLVIPGPLIYVRRACDMKGSLCPAWASTGRGLVGAEMRLSVRVLHGLQHRSDCRSARPARGP